MANYDGTRSRSASMPGTSRAKPRKRRAPAAMGGTIGYNLGGRKSPSITRPGMPSKKRATRVTRPGMPR